MGNIIESYLVSIGFENPDEASFRKVESVLVEAENAVKGHATGMAKAILEAQGAITGAFTSVSAAILGVVDSVAMADQGYRLSVAAGEGAILAEWPAPGRQWRVAASGAGFARRHHRRAEAFVMSFKA